MKLGVAILISMISSIAIAGIYMQDDKNGNTVYSDSPLNGSAKPVTLPKEQAADVSSITSVLPTQSAPQANKADNETGQYKTFSISSPKNEDTIANQPTLNVSIQIDPDLQEGDKIQFYLDGVPRGGPVVTVNTDLGFVERGEHSISAKLFDQNNQVLKESNTVKIYVQRMGVNSPGRHG